MSKIKLTEAEILETKRVLDKHKNTDGSYNVTEAARELGIPRGTMRYRMSSSALTDLPDDPEPTSVDERKLTALMAENAVLKKKLKDAHLNSLDDDAIREILGGIVSTPVNPPKWLREETKHRGVTAEVPMTIWSDWHVGEAVSLSETNGANEYNIEIFRQRAKRLVDRTIDLCVNHGPGNYPGIVINILGDMVSGGLHPELQKTDELETIPSVLECRDMLVSMLEEMIDTFGNVYVPCASGNHGRQTHKPEFKRYIYKNYDFLIYQLLCRHFAGRKEITFDIPDSNEVFYRVFNRRYLAMHGDMLSKGGDGIIGAIGPIMRGEMKLGRQQHGFGQEYDCLLIGHYHQTLWLPRVIVNNTIKGFDEYAAKALRAAPTLPSQSLWFEHPKWGRTMQREVYVDEPTESVTAPWVSVFNEVGNVTGIKRGNQTASDYRKTA